jgi:hypothetical protein
MGSGVRIPLAAPRNFLNYHIYYVRPGRTSSAPQAEAAKKRISRKIGWGRHAPVDKHQDGRTIVLPYGKNEHGRRDALRCAGTPAEGLSERTRD